MIHTYNIPMNVDIKLKKLSVGIVYLDAKDRGDVSMTTRTNNGGKS